MKATNSLEERLARHRTPAPEGFVEAVMDRLPARPARGGVRRRTHWIVPALAGAAVALLLVALVGRRPGADRAAGSPAVATVRFELLAPDAGRVELLGSFNDWQPGTVVLRGPDDAGRWTVELPLGEGRYEYAFLVDGKRWVADPSSKTLRPDGFGHLNAVIEVWDESDDRA